MPVEIREIVTEVVVSRQDDASGTATPAGVGGDDAIEEVVRRATERVLDRLRWEWER